MHPFSLAIKCLWRDDSYITVSQNFEANTWQPHSILFFFFFLLLQRAEIGDPTDITAFTLFPLCSRRLCCYPPRAQCDPRTLCCYFQYKISIQGLLDASHCLFLTPPTCFPLNTRQIGHFWKLALPRPTSFWKLLLLHVAFVISWGQIQRGTFFSACLSLWTLYTRFVIKQSLACDKKKKNKGGADIAKPTVQRKAHAVLLRLRHNSQCKLIH